MKILKSPNDAVFGVAMLAIAAWFYWQAADLRTGTALRMGPGYAPKALCSMIAVMGVLLLGRAVLMPGPALTQWPWRAIGCVVGALAAFAVLMQSAGLAVAIPALVFLACLGDAEARPYETLGLAVALTVFCIGLFVHALGLPFPVFNLG